MSAKIRMYRLGKGLTLEELATAAGLTKSYLSKVERGKSSPSIAIAMRIAQELQVDAAEIFGPTPGNSGSALVETAEARPAAPARAGTPSYVPIAATTPGKHMHPFWVHPGDSGDGPLVEHGGDEFVYVVSGSVELTVDDEVHRMAAGDTAYFAATRPHRLRSVSGPERAVALVTTTVDRHPHGSGPSPESNSPAR